MPKTITGSKTLAEARAKYAALPKEDLVDALVKIAAGFYENPGETEELDHDMDWPSACDIASYTFACLDIAEPEVLFIGAVKDGKVNGRVLRVRRSDIAAGERLSQEYARLTFRGDYKGRIQDLGNILKKRTKGFSPHQFIQLETSVDVPMYDGTIEAITQIGAGGTIYTDSGHCYELTDISHDQTDSVAEIINALPRE